MEKVIIALLLVLCLSCNNIETDTKLLYDIQIDYLDTPINDNRILPNDSIVLCFVGNYQSDTAKTFINHKLYNVSVLTTDDVSGMASDIVLPHYKDIENIGIRINNGKLVYIEPEKKQYNILFDLIDDKVTVRFFRRLPAPM